MENLKYRHCLNMVRQYCDQMNHHNKRVIIDRKIIDDDSYMQWLENYTSVNYSFTTEDRDNRDLETIGRINKLSNLYDLVEYYATVNYLPVGTGSIVSDKFDEVHSYDIMFNGVVYEIGKCENTQSGESYFFGESYYVTRKNPEDSKSCIDFRDIQKGERTERALRIDGLFANIIGSLKGLHEEEVDQEQIVNEISKVLLYSTKRKKDKK